MVRYRRHDSCSDHLDIYNLTCVGLFLTIMCSSVAFDVELAFPLLPPSAQKSDDRTDVGQLEQTFVLLCVTGFLRPSNDTHILVMRPTSRPASYITARAGATAFS